jgi:hypothetical protein
MSEPIERVAKAIYCTEYAEEYWPPSPDELDLVRSQARAAIPAMREPTDEMITAGGVAIILSDPKATAADMAYDCWQAMVYEMLK